MFGENSELELFLFVGELSSVFKRASYVSMSKATAKNDSNVSTKIVAAKFEKEIGFEEVAGERVWRQNGFFDSRKSDYGIEKVNYPENTILHLNQAYLTVKKKIYYCDFYILGQIVEAANLPEDISTYILKENEVKMIRP